MSQYDEIKAYHQYEERYQGLQLEYNGSSNLKSEIYDVIDDVTLETGMIPKLYEYGTELIYIEFHDEYDRHGGEFFTTVLGKLGIEHSKAS